MPSDGSLFIATYNMDRFFTYKLLQEMENLLISEVFDDNCWHPAYFSKRIYKNDQEGDRSIWFLDLNKDYLLLEL